MSATTWSTCGAYDFTCSICRTDTHQSVRSIPHRWLCSVRHTTSAQSDHAGLVARVFANFAIFDFAAEPVLVGNILSIEAAPELSHLPLSVIELCRFVASNAVESGADFELLLVTVAWTWRTPPRSGLRAAHAVSQPASLLGSRPRLTRLAMFTGHVWIQQPRQCQIIHTRWPQSRRKNSQSFPGFCRAITYFFIGYCNKK